MAGDGPQVVDVGQILEDDQRARVAGNLGRRRLHADRQAASVDVESGDLVEQALGRQVDGEVAAERVGERRQPRRRQQHRLNRQATADEAPHHPLALGDEAPLLVEPALLQQPVVGDARIVGVQDVDRRQSHAGRIVDHAAAERLRDRTRACALALCSAAAGRRAHRRLLEQRGAARLAGAAQRPVDLRRRKNAGLDSDGDRDRASAGGRTGGRLRVRPTARRQPDRRRRHPERRRDDRAEGDAAHHNRLARRRDRDEHAAVLRSGPLQQRADLRRRDLLRPASASRGRIPLLGHDHLLPRQDQPDQRVRRTDDRAQPDLGDDRPVFGLVSSPDGLRRLGLGPAELLASRSSSPTAWRARRASQPFVHVEANGDRCRWCWRPTRAI